MPAQIGSYYFITIFEADYYRDFYVYGATIINRTGRAGCMNTGKGGSIEQFYVQATANTITINDGSKEGSWIYCMAYMKMSVI